MSGGDWKDMFAAACRGDVELVRFHVQAGVDVNYAHRSSRRRPWSQRSRQATRPLRSSCSTTAPTRT